MKKKYKDVRPEKTGWRDIELERLLQAHGIEQPDSFLVTEYDYGKSVAIIEYKDISSDPTPDKRLINYCDMRKNKEYYFTVLFDYEKKNSKFRIKKFIVYSGNSYASDFIESTYSRKSPIEMNELEFIDFLYKIRNNTTSKYYKQAVENYEDWFHVDLTFEQSKNIISSRHRSYAYDVPAADIDSIVCDDNNVPYLFVEYKANHNYGSRTDNGHNHFIAKNISFEKKALSNEAKKKLYNKALIDLGDGCKTSIPVIAVEYNLENKIFSLYAYNETAKRLALGSMYQEEYFKYIKEPSNFSEKEKVKPSHQRICPICGSKLEIAKGKYGEFYGCSAFRTTKCRYTENCKKA